ncbi:MAG: pyridoxal phosphate-dependent aminotransferase, partial [Planctomycetota bacterium]
DLTFLTNPNAPSGTLISPRQVKELARSLSGILVVDEAYMDFAEVNCLHLIDSCDNVVVTRTLSKSYSLAGLRFGFAVANEDLVTGMLKVKDSYNVSSPALAGARAAIADQQHVQANVDKIVATRGYLLAQLRELGFYCWPSQTNFVLARVPHPHEARNVFEELFNQKILVRYFDEPRLDDCLRITVGTGEEIDALLTTLQKIM